MSEVFNLDDVQEYFEFSFKGHQYRFKYPTAPEVAGFDKLKTDEETKAFLGKLISKVNDDSPEFTELIDQMTVAHWAKFREMVDVEMLGNAGNQSTKSS